jgi:aminopeptidase YwaD
MMAHELSAKVSQYLQTLCVDLPERPTGSPGNRAATDFFARTIASFGFEVETPTFDCIDWTQQGARLTAGGATFQVEVSPYSPGCAAHAPLVVISTLDELEQADTTGQIVLLRGPIASEQLMPKHFPFYNPDHHQQIIARLEAQPPQAIVAATTENPEMVGALYPFPLFEDGDFDIPSVYMTAAEGDRLAVYAGQPVTLTIHAQRQPAVGCNVVARKRADSARRVVVFAHIDAKHGTPGALDNGCGVVTLLLLAELLKDYDGTLGIEIVALNGEDNYSAAGEILWLERNAGCFDDILLGINIDAVGYHQGQSAYSLYGCSAELTATIESVLTAYADMTAGEPWYQSDHSLFIQNGCPALALTSEAFMTILTQLAHTTQDTPDLVEPARVVHAAQALRDLLLRLDTV